MALGATSCTACDAGKRAVAESVNCTACEAGTYSSSRSENCTLCGKGFVSSEPKSTFCTACEGGKVQPLAGQSLCASCNAGFYQAATGQSACNFCDGGKYSSSSGALSCSSCPAGSFSSTNATACIDCVEGRYSGEGRSSCDLCEKGFYALSAGSTGCVACALGTAQPRNGSSSCIECEAGKYQSSTGQTSCQTCNAGEVSAIVGSASCDSCEPGRYQSLTGQTACIDCTVGTYGPSTALQSCILCDPGYNARKPGSISCERCNPPEMSFGYGGANCSSCQTEYYKDTLTGKCIQCDEEKAKCNNEENGTTLLTINVRKGYYRFDPSSEEIYECPFLDNCQGGLSTGQESCRSGSFGALCELCDDNYYLEGDTNTCESCDNATSGSKVIVLFIVGGVLFVLAIVIIVLMMYNAQRLSEFYMEHEERILQLSAKVTALIVTMQIIVLVNDNHRDLEGATLPQPYGRFLDSLSFLALDMVEFVPLSCLFGRVSHLQGLMAWTVGPLSLIALVSILIVLSKHEQRKVVS